MYFKHKSKNIHFTLNILVWQKELYKWHANIHVLHIAFCFITNAQMNLNLYKVFSLWDDPEIKFFTTLNNYDCD